MASQAVLELVARFKDEASEGLARIGAGLGGIAKTAAGVALGGFLQEGVTALAGFGAESISVAGEFEAGMNRLASVTGDSLSQAGLSLDDFSAKFLELGAETQFSAAQAQDAAIALAKGGIPVADILGNATAATLGLAAAGELELGPAADIVAKQLGVWADTGVTAAQVADQLAQAANASTVDVDELAMGLANVGGTAKVAGVDFADLTQTMALIAPGFSSAADAGTSLATMIRGFQPTTGPATAAMHELGLMTFDTQKAMELLRAEGIEPAGTDMQSLTNQLRGMAGTMGMTMSEADKWLKDTFTRSTFYDAQGAFVGMEEASRLLGTATMDLSEAEKVMAFSTIFGADAIRAASAVAAAGQDGFNAMGDAMVNAGSAADQAAIKQQGFAFALDSLKGTMETVQIVVGSALLPVLTDLLNNVVIPATNGFLTFAQSVLTAEDPIAALVGHIDTAIPGFQSVVGIISSLVGYFQVIAEDGDTLNDFLANLPAVIQPAVLAVGELGLWLGERIPQAIETISAFISGNLEPILAGLAGGGLTALYLVISTVLIPAFTAWAASAATAAAATIAALAPVLLPIAAIGVAVGLLYAAWQNDFGGIATFLTTWWEGTGRPIFEQLQQWLSVQLTAAVATLAQYWQTTLWPALQAVGGWISGTLMPILGTLATNYLAQLGAAVQMLAGFWTGTLWPAIQTVAGWISGTLVPLLVSIGSVYFAAIGKAVELAAAVFTNVLMPPLRDLGSFIASTLGPALSSLGTTVLPPVKEALSGIGSVVRDQVSGALGGMNTLLSKTREWLGWINDRIGDTIEFFNDLADTIDSIEIPSWLKGQSPPPLADWLQYIAEAGWAADDMLGNFGGTASQVAGAIKSLSQSLIDDAFDGTINLARAQVNAIKEIQGFADGAVPERDTSQADALRKERLKVNKEIAELEDALRADYHGEDAGEQRGRLQELQKEADYLKLQEDQAKKTADATYEQAKAQQAFMQLIAQEAQGQLEVALAEAQKLQATDPKAASDFFKMRRDQIMELAEIQKDMADGTTSAEYAALARQRDLILQAQAAERLAFEEDLRRREQARRDAAQNILNDLGGITNGQDKNKDGKEDFVGAEILNGWVDQLRGMTGLVSQGNVALLNFIDTLTQSSTPTSPGGLYGGGPLGPSPVININVATGVGRAEAEAGAYAGTQRALAEAGVQADLRRRGQ